MTDLQSGGLVTTLQLLKETFFCMFTSAIKLEKSFFIKKIIQQSSKYNDVNVSTFKIYLKTLSFFSSIFIWF